MTSQVFHQAFNDAVNRILNNAPRTKDGTRKFGDFDFTVAKEANDRTLVYAITDNSDKENVVRVSHRVEPGNYRGTFEMAVNGQTTSAEEQEEIGRELFKRVLNTPVPAFARTA